MNALESSLYNQLSGGTALTALLGGTVIYNSLAPRDHARPYVVFSQASGVEENYTPRRSLRFVYLVKGVADSQLTAGQIADAVDDLVHGAALAVSGWNTSFWCHRESTVRYIELDDAGHEIAHAGALYQIRLAK